MQNKKEQKLRKQIARFEAKGYMDTAHHEMLKRLLQSKPVAGVSSGTPKKVKQEARDGE